MNLDRKKYPVLDSLVTGVFPLPFDRLDVREIPTLMENRFREDLQAGLEAFRSQVLYPSQPFLDAALRASGPLARFYAENAARNEPALELSGTVVYRGWVVMIQSALLPERDGRFLLWYCWGAN